MESSSTLQLVQIHFDTATFDDIERDKKIKTEAQVSLIGGTMGLFSGFSIISGIEIVFFVAKFLFKVVAHCNKRYLQGQNDKSTDKKESKHSDIGTTVEI